MIDRAALWIEPYWNAEHLRRTNDWLLTLEPDAVDALQLAALTHDIERHFPGGPSLDLSLPPEEDTTYQKAHSERSARIVGAWLRDEGATPQTVEHVEHLIKLHETGGDGEADLLQAADSISFLEVNVDVPYRWADQGLCDLERASAQHRWMFERIRLPRARELAQPYFEQAVARGS